MLLVSNALASALPVVVAAVALTVTRSEEVPTLVVMSAVVPKMKSPVPSPTSSIPITLPAVEAAVALAVAPVVPTVVALEMASPSTLAVIVPELPALTPVP